MSGWIAGATVVAGIGSSFIGANASKQAGDRASRANKEATDQAGRELDYGFGRARGNLEFGSKEARDQILRGLTGTDIALQEAETRAARELNQGVDEAQVQLNQADAFSRGQLYGSRDDAFAREQGLNEAGRTDFQSLQQAAGGQITNAEAQALAAQNQGFTQAQGSVGAGFQQAQDQIGQGFGNAQSLGQNYLQAGNVGVAGLQDFVDPNGEAVQRQLAQIDAATNADLAKRGLYGSTGGAQVAATNRFEALDANEQQRLAVLSQLAQQGQGQVGAQQGLYTQQGLAQSGLSTQEAQLQANLAAQQGSQAANIAQQAGTQQAGILQSQGSGLLQSRGNQAQLESELASKFGLAASQNTLQTGENIANLRSGLGNSLGALSSQTGINRANSLQNFSNNLSNLATSSSETMANLNTQQGAANANVLTGYGAAQGQIEAGRARSTNAALSSGLQAIGTGAGIYAGSKKKTPALSSGSQTIGTEG